MSSASAGSSVAFNYSSDAETEIGAFFKDSGKVTIPLDVREILDHSVAASLPRPYA